jgi:hypothetical protein
MMYIFSLFQMSKLLWQPSIVILDSGLKNVICDVSVCLEASVLFMVHVLLWGELGLEVMSFSLNFVSVVIHYSKCHFIYKQKV